MIGRVPELIWGLAGAGLGFLASLLAFKTRMVLIERSLARISRGLGAHTNRQLVILQAVVDLAQKSGADQRLTDRLLSSLMEQLTGVQHASGETEKVTL